MPVRQICAALAPENLFEEMQRYVRFTGEDVVLLEELGRHAAPRFEQIAADFFERIREHEDAHAVLTGEDQVRRLRASLIRWMERLCAGPHDEAYFAQTSNIGRVHVRVGLPQRYMHLAMAQIRAAFEGIADASMGARAAAARHAIGRALDLELAVMAEAYKDDYVRRIQRAGQIEADGAGRTPGQIEHRYRDAVELSRMLFVGLDARATIRLFNREAERVTGFGREEVIGKPFVDTLLPEGLRDEQGRLLRSAAAGLPTGTELLESAVCTRAGKIREVCWQLAHVASAPAEAQDDVTLFVIGQDSTDQNALAARARQREKLAAVGVLASGLAHEIRNPLNGAHLHVTFLERGLRRSGVEDEEVFDALGVVGEEIQRLSQLMNDFLEFAQPRPLAKRPVSVRAICERATKLITPYAEAAGVEILDELPRAELIAEIDASRMEQVLSILLRNAVEAMEPGGGGRLLCRALRQPRHAAIEVEDEGPGLPDLDAPIFDPFYSTKPRGTGLGLAIAHRVVTDHGGTIDVTSRPGRTVFRVTLPLSGM